MNKNAARRTTLPKSRRRLHQAPCPSVIHRTETRKGRRTNRRPLCPKAPPHRLHPRPLLPLNDRPFASTHPFFILISVSPPQCAVAPSSTSSFLQAAIRSVSPRWHVVRVNPHRIHAKRSCTRRYNQHPGATAQTWWIRRTRKKMMMSRVRCSSA